MNASELSVVTFISMLCGNTAYCVKLNGDDLSRCSNKIESAALRDLRIGVTITNTSQTLLLIMAGKRLVYVWDEEITSLSPCVYYSAFPGRVYGQ